MSSKGKTPEEWISFLLTVIEHVPAKPDWNKFATDTGAYKSGKFAAVAYANLRKKYNLLPSIKDGANAPATPGSAKKRAKPADFRQEDDEEIEEKPKRGRKPKQPKKEIAKKEIDDDEDVKIEMVKDEESDDVLNGDTTIEGEDHVDQD